MSVSCIRAFDHHIVIGNDLGDKPEDPGGTAQEGSDSDKCIKLVVSEYSKKIDIPPKKNVDFGGRGGT